MDFLRHYRYTLFIFFVFCHSCYAATCKVPQKLIFRPTSLAYQKNTLYVLGRGYETFYSINLKNCHSQYITGGEKNGFVSPLGLADNSNKGQWVVLDSGTGMINIKNGKILGMIGNKMPDMLSTVFHLTDDPDYFIAIGDRSVYKVNFSTGKITIISDATHGTGPLMQDLRAVTISQNRIFALDYHEKKIYEINLKDGNRHVFVDLKNFSKMGVKCQQPFGIASSNTELFVTDPQAKQILSINIKSHNVSVLNSNKTQKNNPMIAPIGTFYDATEHTLYVSDFGKNAIYSLVISNNAIIATRHTVAEMGKTTSYPNEMVFPVDIMITKTGDLLIGDQHAAAVFKLNPKTKKLTLFSAPNKGNGPIMLEVNALHQFSHDSILLTDTSLTRVYEIDQNGNRTVFSPADNNVPGDPIWITKGLNYNWYISSGGDNKIYQFHFDLKNHTVHSQLVSDNNGKGEGPHLHNLLGIVWDSKNNQLIVANQGPNDLLFVNSESGNRTVLSGKNKGDGPEFKYLAGLAFVYPDTIYVADSFRPALIRVNIKNGNRTIVSGVNDGKIIGKGPMFKTPASIALTDYNKKAYITDPHGQAVYAINLKSGDRELLKTSARQTK